MNNNLIGFFLLLAGAVQANAQPAKSLKLVSEHTGPVISADHPDVLASGNRSGFETGQVVKLGNTYHMFVNEMFDRPHRDLRISYWTSTNAVDWKRQSTIVSSIPGRTSANPRSEVWVNAVVLNEEEDAWDIFYVAYRAGDSTKGEIPGSDYEGKIWRAKSVKKGRDGIAGPYADMGIVLQPDENSQAWEGQQAIASFFPYKTGTNTWLAIYDGHNYIPKTGWPDGMAFSSNLNGPWTRMPEGFNPLTIAEEFAENAIVSRMKNKRYLMVFDSFGNQEIGYSISDDGVFWSKETRVKVQSKNLWAEKGDHYTRTPLCAIEEEDGTFTVVYTARTKIGDKNFYAIGKCSLSWK